MLNYNDLRLDNWILEKGTPVQVHMLAKGLTHYTINGVNLDKKTGKVVGTDEDRFSGIELSVEVLQACGFIKGVTGYQKNVAFPNYKVMIFRVQQNFERAAICFGSDGTKSNAAHDVIQIFDADSGEKFYLHELQNIYKDLTNREISYHPVTISEKAE